MNIIPNVKKAEFTGEHIILDKIKWVFEEAIDERVIKEAKRIRRCDETGIPVYINHRNGTGEEYSIDITKTEIHINADSGAGAFYALKTLKMLVTSTDRKLKCCKITDSPDMEYRGFYHDITRGRVPTLDALKKLVDLMADYKLNSLQLYIEHTYDFKEYAHCKEKLGYMTKAEIQELDAYCNERFIELVPSLATFGHLYHLLQSEEYKHLCELKDYEPSWHYQKERMQHHTINPLLDESFELIKSLIDQHMEAFTSDKFNICCDETFDLGKDVNLGKDEGELYIGFVKKLVAYLESKGKTVLMWGDIVIQHPDKINDLSDNIIFLSWEYSANPDEGRISPLKDKLQYICPGTSSWEGFHERVHTEEGNILKMIEYGVKYGAKGILNTNWGDVGNPSSIDMAMYGLILGAAAGWNTKTEVTTDFRKFVSDYYYGCSEALDILEQLSIASDYANWNNYNWEWCNYPDSSEKSFKDAMQVCENMIQKIENCEFKNSEIKKEFSVAARGDSLMIDWCAHKMGYSVKSTVDFDSWIKDFEYIWLKDSKRSELDESIKIFNNLNKGEIFN